MTCHSAVEIINCCIYSNEETMYVCDSSITTIKATVAAAQQKRCENMIKVKASSSPALPT